VIFRNKIIYPASCKKLRNINQQEIFVLIWKKEGGAPDQTCSENPGIFPAVSEVQTPACLQ